MTKLFLWCNKKIKPQSFVSPICNQLALLYPHSFNFELIQIPNKVVESFSLIFFLLCFGEYSILVDISITSW